MGRIDGMTKSQKDNMRRSRRRKMKMKMNRKEEEGPVICLYVEHVTLEMGHSIYLIQPKPDDLESEISPILTFPYEEKKFLPGSASVSLGSKVYFFGGYFSEGVFKVQAFDTQRPDLGIQSVASMHTPKETPCVFVADGMIYALSCPPIDDQKLFISLGGIDATGSFERYDPVSHRWQVLPDPPYFCRDQSIATVVGRRVFIGHCCGIFNLDSLNWEPVLSPSLYLRFPYGSLYAEDEGSGLGSLYYLRGTGASRLGEDILVPDHESFQHNEPLNVVKRGPLPLPLPLLGNDTLLNSPCLDPDTDLIVTSASDLVDPSIFFSDNSFKPWRKLFHMGGRIFCYVVTAQLIEWGSLTINQPNSRGVWIKFFEEVEGKFRTLASFCYEIKTKFNNTDEFIRWSVLGSVPQSWIKDPPGNKVQESKLMRLKGSEVLQKDTNSSKVETMSEEYGNLMKLLTDQEEKISKLVAELSRKDEDLKAKEAALAKIKAITLEVGV